MRRLYEGKRESVVARVAKHRAENIIAIREYDRQRANNPERVELHAQRSAVRRARLKNVACDLGVTRRNLRIQYGDDCFYCSVSMSFERLTKGQPRPANLATIDHVYPIALGGSHTWDNTVLACLRCNTSKRHLTLSEWLSSR